jgi:hypothetical protein
MFFIFALSTVKRSNFDAYLHFLIAPMASRCDRDCAIFRRLMAMIFK